MEWFSSFVLSGRPVGAFLALGLVLAQPVGPAGADTLEVPGQYPTIQAAINAAQTGDEILVAPGVYPERIHLLGKTITLRGTAGPDLTIIDATGLNQDVIICTNGEGPDTIVQGFTVTGGVDGIRTRLSAPTLSDCLFVANAGHGMSCEEAAPVAFDCAFSDNIDCGIQNVIGAPVLERCAIEGNGAGGVFSLGPAIVTLLDCSLIGNTAVFGAGLHNLDGGAARLVNCTFIANQASYSGGGLLNDSDCQVHLVNCLFSDNSAGVDGGAVYNLESDLEVSNGTFSANAAGRDGGAVLHAGGTATIANSILWSNDGGEIHPLFGEVSVSYSNVFGGWDGPGGANLDADPMFTDPGAGEYDLAPGSPCIDAADNAALPPDELDLDDDGDTDEPIPLDLAGEARVIDDPDTEDTGHGEPPIVDMGAYEFQPSECPADFDGDGDVDTADLLFLLGAWGTPDGDVDGDGDTDTADVLALLAAWGDCP